MTKYNHCPVVAYPEGVVVGKVRTGLNPSGTKVRHVAFDTHGERLGTYDTFKDASASVVAAARAKNQDGQCPDGVRWRQGDGLDATAPQLGFGMRYCWTGAATPASVMGVGPGERPGPQREGPPMTSRTTTITFPNGATATRTSNTRTYTHAVIVGPIPAARYAHWLDDQAAETQRVAEVIASALIHPRVSIRRHTRTSGIDPYNTCTATLEGVPYAEHITETCNPQGITRGVRDPETHEWDKDATEPAAGAVVRAAHERLTHLYALVDQLHAKAEQRRNSGEAYGGWTVIRWSSRLDLAVKAARDFHYYTGQGRPVIVVDVD